MSSSSMEIRAFERVARASRRAAALSLLGALVVLGSLAYAARQLTVLQSERTRLLSQRDSLRSEIRALQRSTLATRRELVNARQAVAATRWAINAFQANDFAAAVQLYDQALALDPNNAYVKNLQAYALFRNHRLGEAIAAQQASLRMDPAYAWGYFDLARFLCADNQAAAARAAAARAIQLRADMRSIMARDGEFQRVCRGML